jgi:Protein of unknown function VcgC/VcgE (DUF2780)
MTRNVCLGIVCATLVAAAAALAGTTAAQAPTPAAAQTAGGKASPELVNALSKELGATPEQSAAAAGALFQVAKTRLEPEEFAQVSKAANIGSANNLASAMSVFNTLGLKPDLLTKAVPVLTSFVSKSGGADAAKLLAGALT